MAIEAKELRVGNWYKWNNVAAQLEGINHLIDLDNNKTGYVVDLFKNEKLLQTPWLSELEPIPLTPEILEKCGFEIIYPVHDDKRMLSSRYVADNKNIRVIFDYNKRIVLIDINETIIKHHFLFNHLHQLQNLYFALTGEELEVNL